MPSQGAIGHGMPTVNQQPGQYSLGVNRAPARMYARNFKLLEEGEFTLSETLQQASWEKILPPSGVLEKFIKDQLANSSYKFNKKINTTNWWASWLFLASVFGLFNRGLWHLFWGDLISTAHWSEHLRVFSDILGYFLAPFIITFRAATINQKMIDDAEKNAGEKLKFITEDYDDIRTAFITAHNHKMAFCALTEIIYTLKIKPETILEQERKLITVFNKIGFTENLCAGTTARRLCELSIDCLIARLKNILLGPKFVNIMDNVQKVIKLDMLSQRSIHFANRKNYCNNIDKSRSTRELALEVLGELSVEKTKPNSSVLLKAIQVTEESTLESIKTALSEYWNSPDIGEVIVHPYDVNLPEIALVFNDMMLEKRPALLQLATDLAAEDALQLPVDVMASQVVRPILSVPVRDGAPRPVFVHIHENPSLPFGPSFV